MVTWTKFRVAGVDGTPGGWAALIAETDRTTVRKIASLSEIFKIAPELDVIAIDVPIGLLDNYQSGGRVCDCAARKVLGSPRGSSVFPAPVRGVLAARSWHEASAISRASAPNGKGISKQTFAIVPKIKEVDELLQAQHELRPLLREIHPELSFCELAGHPMSHRKSSGAGRQERRLALRSIFVEPDAIEKSGIDQGLPIEDIFDAAVACWSAWRLANGEARSLPAVAPLDATGLPMAIWI
jgi:predicted RNase H-like nuclease